MISVKKTVHGTLIEIDGEIVAIITAATGVGPTQNFIALCNEHEVQLGFVTEEARIKRVWNSENRGKGRDWPAFTARDKFIDGLLKQAGIRNT